MNTDLARQYDEEDLPEWQRHNAKFIGWLRRWLGMPSSDNGCGVTYDY